MDLRTSLERAERYGVRETRAYNELLEQAQVAVQHEKRIHDDLRNEAHQVAALEQAARDSAVAVATHEAAIAAQAVTEMNWGQQRQSYDIDVARSEIPMSLWRQRLVLSLCSEKYSNNVCLSSNGMGRSTSRASRRRRQPAKLSSTQQKGHMRMHSGPPRVTGTSPSERWWSCMLPWPVLQSPLGTSCVRNNTHFAERRSQRSWLRNSACEDCFGRKWSTR